MAFVIMFGHAAIVFLFGRTKFSLTVAALASAAIGIFIGNPSYLALDLAGVVIGYIIGWRSINESQQYTAKPTIEEKVPTESSTTSDKSFTPWVLAFAGVVLYFIISDKSVKPNTPSTYVSPPYQTAPLEFKPQHSAINNETDSIPSTSNTVQTPNLVQAEPLKPPPSNLVQAESLKPPLSTLVLRDERRKDNSKTPHPKVTQNQDIHPNITLESIEQVTPNNPYLNVNDAVRDNNTLAVEQLIKGGADPNYSRSGNPPLIQAVLNNNLEIVNLLLSSGVNPESRDSHGFTAVARAKNATHPNKEIIDLLYQYGATNPYKP